MDSTVTTISLIMVCCNAFLLHISVSFKITKVAKHLVKMNNSTKRVIIPEGENPQ